MLCRSPQAGAGWAGRMLPSGCLYMWVMSSLMLELIAFVTMSVPMAFSSTYTILKLPSSCRCQYTLSLFTFGEQRTAGLKGQEDKRARPQCLPSTPGAAGRADPPCSESRGRSLSRRLLVAHFGINNSNSLCLFACYTTNEAPHIHYLF